MPSHRMLYQVRLVFVVGRGRLFLLSLDNEKETLDGNGKFDTASVSKNCGC